MSIVISDLLNHIMYRNSLTTIEHELVISVVKLLKEDKSLIAHIETFPTSIKIFTKIQTCFIRDDVEIGTNFIAMDIALKSYTNEVDTFLVICFDWLNEGKKQSPYLAEYWKIYFQELLDSFCVN